MQIIPTTADGRVKNFLSLYGSQGPFEWSKKKPGL